MKTPEIATILLILAAAALQSGCATAKATGYEAAHPQVEITIHHFAPDEEVVMTFADGKTARDTGVAVLDYRAYPPGLTFSIEQSPDLINWAAPGPVHEQILRLSQDYTHYRGIYQILIDPATGSNSNQFFRATF